MSCGSPINLSSGNVYIEQNDYSLPGLGGGISLSRSWNSLWQNSRPDRVAGMFGNGWQSTYEGGLAFPDSNTAKYWRADGSGWTFAYTQATHSYTLTTPPNAHATLIQNPSDGSYTLTSPDGSERLFNNSGLLTGMVDRNGNQVTFSYDQSNRLVQVTDPGGRSLSFTYGDANNPNLVSSIQDSTGGVAQYSYDTSGNLIHASYADGSGLNYAYDTATNMLLSVTDGQSKLIEAHTYDSSDRGLTSTRANGVDALSLTYANLGGTQLTDSMGRTTTYVFTSIGGKDFLASASGPGCDTCGQRGDATFTYDGLGNMNSSTDALGRATSYTYDSNGNVLTKSIQVGGSTLTWTYTYNQFDEVLTSTDPMGDTTTNNYDTHGNLLSTTSPPPSGTGSGPATIFGYDLKGELTQVTDPRGNSTTMAYTAAGLISSITDAQGHATSFAYDARGNRISTTDALSNTTTFGYDAMNRLTSITQPNGSATTFTYDTRGRRTSVTDANNKTTQYQYDDADRLTQVTDAANNITGYQYDTENNLTSISDAMSRVTSFGYDAMGRVTSTTFPSTLSETYTYDAVGNLLSKTDRKGQTITYAYDNFDRLTSKTYPSSGGVSYTYDADSWLMQATDATGTYSFTYDNFGRLTGTTTNYSFLSGRTLTESYSYDAASNRVSFTDPEGGTTSYTYDSLNRLTSLTDFNGKTFGFSYDALGRRTSLTRSNQMNTTYSYDSLSRLLEVRIDKNSKLQESLSYTYDTVGNRMSVTGSTPGKGNTINQSTSNYSYDAIYQLIQKTYGGGSVGESYTYDPVGNRLSSLGVSPYTYNNSNELTSRPQVNYSYDSNGNLSTLTDSSSGTPVRWNFGWDFENRLTSGGATYQYDPFGRRIEKASWLGTTIYVYGGDNVVEELDSSGNVQSRFTQGLGIDEPLAWYDGGTGYYFHADALGSIIALSYPTGGFADTYTYDSFGNLTGTSSNIHSPFGYTGRERDSETGFLYYRARYCDPKIGRFISEDPIGFEGGANFYAYVANNPMNWVDPSGKVKCVYIIQTSSSGRIGPVLACTSDDNTRSFMTRNVRSGFQTCENEPSCSGRENKGPIPPGLYSTGGVGQTPNPHNPARIPIWRAPGNPTTRTNLEFHPGSTWTSSTGCIAIDRPDYDRFVKFYQIDNKGTLTVLDWLRILP